MIGCINIDCNHSHCEDNFLVFPCDLELWGRISTYYIFMLFSTSNKAQHSNNVSIVFGKEFLWFFFWALEYNFRQKTKTFRKSTGQSTRASNDGRVRAVQPFEMHHVYMIWQFTWLALSKRCSQRKKKTIKQYFLGQFPPDYRDIIGFALLSFTTGLKIPSHFSVQLEERSTKHVFPRLATAQSIYFDFWLAQCTDLNVFCDWPGWLLFFGFRAVFNWVSKVIRQ